jgi:chemotaxis protein methyltransferase CheR
MTATDSVFAILKSVVEDRAGLHYAQADAPLFLDKVSQRMGEAGFESLLDYYYFLQYDPAGKAELDRLVDALVVNETFFFRELKPLEVIVERLLVPRIKAGGRPSVWCAACSTGEEPLTLAMLLAERDLLSRVNILASDISTRALAAAAAGRFGRRSLREQPPPALVQRWLDVKPNGQVEVKPVLREKIDFRRINLIDSAERKSAGHHDVILCRNVLIYFSDERTTEVVTGLIDQLEPSGALFVGVSESLLRFGTSLECEEIDDVFLYRKTA